MTIEIILTIFLKNFAAGFPDSIAPTKSAMILLTRLLKDPSL